MNEFTQKKMIRRMYKLKVWALSSSNTQELAKVFQLYFTSLRQFTECGKI